MELIADSFSEDEFIGLAAGPGVFYRVGPFQVHLTTPIRDVASLVLRLYGAYEQGDPHAVSDFHVSILPARGIRRFVRPQVQFFIDGMCPFDPFPLDSAFPLLEWGINWCIGSRAQQYLVLHSAVIEKNGKSVVLAAEAGSGKSTLAAALMLSGWRLFSDEFGLMRPGTCEFVPVPRTIALKNESIEVIRRFSRDATLGPEFPKTRKGTVAHLAASAESAVDQTPAPPVLVVFPKFEVGAALRSQPLAKAAAFMKLASNAFNYSEQGETGFDLVKSIIDASEIRLLKFSRLDSAIGAISEFVQ
jgi:HprK-related kinase A